MDDVGDGDDDDVHNGDVDDVGDNSDGASCEVGGLFQHLIPQNVRDRPEAKNQSHVKVPDFRIQPPSSTPTKSSQGCP